MAMQNYKVTNFDGSCSVQNNAIYHSLTKNVHIFFLGINLKGSFKQCTRKQCSVGWNFENGAKFTTVEVWFSFTHPLSSLNAYHECIHVQRWNVASELYYDLHTHDFVMMNAFENEMVYGINIRLPQNDNTTESLFHVNWMSFNFSFNIYSHNHSFCILHKALFIKWYD